jgi:hemerythrin-like metal-binding protein
MPLIEWDDAMEVGDAAIDAEHRQLAQAVNALYEDIVQGHSANQVKAALEDIAAHTDRHFRHEERIMRANGYPGLAEHARQHAELEASIADLLERFEAGESLYSLRVVNFLADWLLIHIRTSDKALGLYLTARRAN